MPGFVFCIIAFVGYAFASSGYMLYVFMIPGALQGFVMPSVNAIMSAHIPGNSQGELQGGMASMNSVTAILGPPLMTATFAFFTAEAAPVYFPGAAFALGAVLTLLSLVVFMRAEARWK